MGSLNERSSVEHPSMARLTLISSDRVHRANGRAGLSLLLQLPIVKSENLSVVGAKSESHRSTFSFKSRAIAVSM